MSTPPYPPTDPLDEHHHIRDIAKTRLAYEPVRFDWRDGKLMEDLVKSHEGVTMCGLDTRGRTDRIWFQDIDHAILHLRDNGDFGACRRCLRAILHVIREELSL